MPDDEELRVDEAEAVDHDLPLHGLDRVDDDADRAGVELLEALLRVDVGATEPASEPACRTYM